VACAACGKRYSSKQARTTATYVAARQGLNRGTLSKALAAKREEAKKAAEATPEDSSTSKEVDESNNE